MPISSPPCPFYANALSVWRKSSWVARRLGAVMLLTVIGLGLSMVSASARAQQADDPTTKAKTFFEQYITLESAGNPALLEFYDDSAKIRIYKAHKDGSRIREAIELPQYKDMLKSTLAVKSPNTYSDVSYTILNNNVKIRAIRVVPSANKKADKLPYQLLVGPGASGQWKILEETTTVETTEGE